MFLVELSFFTIFTPTKWRRETPPERKTLLYQSSKKYQPWQSTFALALVAREGRVDGKDESMIDGKTDGVTAGENACARMDKSKIVIIAFTTSIWTQQ